MQDGSGRAGRNRLLWVVAVFLAPVIASYLFYYVWPPEGAATNYGELIEPVTLEGDLMLYGDVPGQMLPLRALRGKWTLVHAAPAACDPSCLRQLDLLRRVRLMQGREQDRVQVVWVVTDSSPPTPGSMPAPSGVRVLRDPQGALTGRLPVKTALSRHIYVIDPLGNVMMRYDADPDPKRMAQDLARLLRASQIG